MSPVSKASRQGGESGEVETHPQPLPHDDISVPAPTWAGATTSSASRSSAGGGKGGEGKVKGEGEEGKRTGRGGAAGQLAKQHLLGHLAWVVPVVKDWSKMKPVLRSALAAWLCMLCLLISPIEVALGSASFLVLVGIFIQPCELPMVATVEREFFTVSITVLGWAYCNLAVLFAHLARRTKIPAAMVNQEFVYNGEYIETGPTAICLTFLAFGIASLLYLKVKFGPSPFLFASIIGCIGLDITLVYAPLYPYPVYTLGQAIVLPLALKAAISIVVSCLFFPKSVNSTFVERLVAVLKPMGESSRTLLEMHKHSPVEADFNFDMMHAKVAQAEAGLAPLRGSARLLTREVSFGLANGEDLKSLVQLFVAMLAPADGISYYFSSIKVDLQGMDIHMHPRASKFNTPAPTRPVTPTQSVPPTPTGEQHDEGGASSQIARQRLRSQLTSSEARSDSPRRHSHELRHRMQNALHHWPWRNAQQPHAEPVEVGLWESLRYAVVESQQHSRHNDRYTVMCFELLGQVSTDLLKEQAEAMEGVMTWLSVLNRERITQLRKAFLFFSKRDWPGAAASTMEKGGMPKSFEQSIKGLEEALRQFKLNKYIILEPFRSSVERGAESGAEKIPHRYLFQCFSYCYFQVQFTDKLTAFLQGVHQIETKRRRWQFWLPTLPKLLQYDTWRMLDVSDHESLADHDEDPDQIPGMASSLGKTRARDPEALEGGEDDLLQSVGRAISSFLGQLFRGNSLFMIKAALVTVLVALPSVVRPSAGWAYRNKAIWVVIMSQLTLARHRGEVLFSLASRVISTFSGAIMGMLIWYIASGDGVANPYVMALVTAFGFPIVMLIRLHLPGPPITAIIACVTTALVVGYSWKDSHNPTYGSPGIGWDVTWRRFVEVVIGSTAAYIVAILPPSSSMRKYFRISHATAIGETGGVYCQVVTLAASPNTVETKQTIDQLIAIRAKVRRLKMLKLSISYEWSLRGRWPLKRYEELEEVEMQLSKLLTHAVTICENLGPVYSRALLRRTHFLDPVFLADCIAILTMCTSSLRTSQPLPQIVPVLIDRYLSNVPGFQFRAHDEDSYSAASLEEETIAQLPKVVMFDTICKEEYQTFAVGVLVAYGIVLRLDRLCLAVKALVGESYSVPTDLHFDYHR